MITHLRILIAVLATLVLLSGCGPFRLAPEPALEVGAAPKAPVGAENGVGGPADYAEPTRAPSADGAATPPPNSPDGHDPRVAGLAFLEDGDLLASAGCIFSLRLWNVDSGQEVGSPVVPGCRAYALAFSPDGSLVAVGDAEKRIQIWDVKAGQQQSSLRGHGTYVMRLTFSPDGKLLASAGDDNSIKIWDLDSGQVVQDLMGHITPVTALAFSPDGSMLASGSVQFSTTIMLWDLASGKVRRTLVDHTGNINDLAFSPDGTLLASASADRTARIWRIKSGQVLYILAGQNDPVYALAFSPDGDLLAYLGRRWRHPPVGRRDGQGNETAGRPRRISISPGFFARWLAAGLRRRGRHGIAQDLGRGSRHRANGPAAPGPASSRSSGDQQHRPEQGTGSRAPSPFPPTVKGNPRSF